jgi:2'-5' RNA ligase
MQSLEMGDRVVLDQDAQFVEGDWAKRIPSGALGTVLESNGPEVMVRFDNPNYDSPDGRPFSFYLHQIRRVLSPEVMHFSAVTASGPKRGEVSCVMAPVDVDTTGIQALIPDSDLYEPEDPQYGREKHPHVTVLFGLVTEDPNDVAKVLQGLGPASISFDSRISMFSNPGDYDVLKVDASSEDLEKIHDLLKEKLENKDEWPTYKAHLTIAYVKKDTGVKYVGKSVSIPSATVDALEFSNYQEQKTVIPLDHAVQTSLKLSWEMDPNETRVASNINELLNKSKPFQVWANPDKESKSFLYIGQDGLTLSKMHEPHGMYGGIWAGPLEEQLPDDIRVTLEDNEEPTPLWSILFPLTLVSDDWREPVAPTSSLKLAWEVEDSTPETDSNGDTFWYNSKGKLHRTDGPAIEWADGSKEWYVNDKLHRTDGPAIERANGDKEWWVNDKLHRTDGPAIEWADGDKAWYVNDKLHRTDGPAVELADGSKAWYVNGRELTEEEFNRRRHASLKLAWEVEQEEMRLGDYMDSPEELVGCIIYDPDAPAIPFYRILRARRQQLSGIDGVQTSGIAGESVEELSRGRGHRTSWFFGPGVHSRFQLVKQKASSLKQSWEVTPDTVRIRATGPMMWSGERVGGRVVLFAVDTGDEGTVTKALSRVHHIPQYLYSVIWDKAPNQLGDYFVDIYSPFDVISGDLESLHGITPESSSKLSWEVVADIASTPEELEEKLQPYQVWRSVVEDTSDVLRFLHVSSDSNPELATARGDVIMPEGTIYLILNGSWQQNLGGAWVAAYMSRAFVPPKCYPMELVCEDWRTLKESSLKLAWELQRPIPVRELIEQLKPHQLWKWFRRGKPFSMLVLGQRPKVVHFDTPAYLKHSWMLSDAEEVMSYETACDAMLEMRNTSYTHEVGGIDDRYDTFELVSDDWRKEKTTSLEKQAWEVDPYEEFKEKYIGASVRFQAPVEPSQVSETVNYTRDDLEPWDGHWATITGLETPYAVGKHAPRFDHCEWNIRFDGSNREFLGISGFYLHPLELAPNASLKLAWEVEQGVRIRMKEGKSAEYHRIRISGGHEGTVIGVERLGTPYEEYRVLWDGELLPSDFYVSGVNSWAVLPEKVDVISGDVGTLPEWTFTGDLPSELAPNASLKLAWEPMKGDLSWDIRNWPPFPFDVYMKKGVPEENRTWGGHDRKLVIPEGTRGVAYHAPMGSSFVEVLWEGYPDPKEFTGHPDASPTWQVRTTNLTLDPLTTASLEKKAWEVVEEEIVNHTVWDIGFLDAARPRSWLAIVLQGPGYDTERPDLARGFHNVLTASDTAEQYLDLVRSGDPWEYLIDPKAPKTYLGSFTGVEDPALEPIIHKWYENHETNMYIHTASLKLSWEPEMTPEEQAAVFRNGDKAYWQGNGDHQKEYELLWEDLVPASGEASSPVGEALRQVSRIYYDLYNNGFGNGPFSTDGLERFRSQIMQQMADPSAWERFFMYFHYKDEGEGYVSDSTAWSGAWPLEQILDATVKFVRDWILTTGREDWPELAKKLEALEGKPATEEPAETPETPPETTTASLKLAWEVEDSTPETDSYGTTRWRNSAGKFHRTDGPAVEYADGSKAWYVDGKRHRTDGPAIEYADGGKLWYVDGKRHRTDGPAVEYADGRKYWYVDGQELTEEEFNRRHQASLKLAWEVELESTIRDILLKYAVSPTTAEYIHFDMLPADVAAEHILAMSGGAEGEGQHNDSPTNSEQVFTAVAYQGWLGGHWTNYDNSEGTVSFDTVRLPLDVDLDEIKEYEHQWNPSESGVEGDTYRMWWD